MPYASVPIHNRRIVFAIAVVGVCTVFASSTRAQATTNSMTAPTYTPTTWTITIIATGPGPHPADYTVARTDLPGGNGCPNVNSHATVKRLKICSGDTVLWKTDTKSDSNNTEMLIVHKDAILDNTSGATHIFHESKGNPAGGPTDKTALADNKEHKYFVFVFGGPVPYFEDPKIIIGTGSKPRPKHPKESTTPK